MNNNCKRLILDKDIFVGSSEKKLCQFAKNHFLILPEVLIYECATSQEGKKEKLLQRLTNIIKTGGYTCPSVGLMVEKESRQGYPYGNIEDIPETEKIRVAPGIQWAQERCQKMQEHEMHMAKEVHKLSQIIGKKMEETRNLDFYKPYVKVANKISQKNKEYVFENRLQVIDLLLEIKSTLTGTLKDKPQDWIDWHYQRLFWLYLTFLGDMKDSNVNLNNIEHYLQDRSYIVLLCRADGLLTKDKSLTILAKAAFPQKEIFADLEKVPETYIYDQTG
jgi:hypothetical protein